MSFGTCARGQKRFRNKEAKDKAAAKATKERARGKDRRREETAQEQREAVPPADGGPCALYKKEI